MRGDDGVVRCAWGDSTPDYRVYHDEEWGRPVGDDVRLFEKLCLEGFQSGLSWLTILRKRENFRAAFAGFDFTTVAEYTERRRRAPAPGRRDHPPPRQDRGDDQQRPARASRWSTAEGSLARFVWGYDDPTPLAKELKRRGWRFVGPTTVYAFMQAMGLVNDHLPGLRRPRAVRARARGVHITCRMTAHPSRVTLRT